MKLADESSASVDRGGRPCLDAFRMIRTGF